MIGFFFYLMKLKNKWENLLMPHPFLTENGESSSIKAPYYQISMTGISHLSKKWISHLMKIAFLSFVLPYAIQSNPIVQVLISCLWTVEKEEGSKRQTCHKRLPLRKSSSVTCEVKSKKGSFLAAHFLSLQPHKNSVRGLIDSLNRLLDDERDDIRYDRHGGDN